MVGTEVAKTDRNAVSFQGWGFCYENGNIPFVDYNLFKQQVEEGSTYYSNQWTYRRSAAFFGTATYSYAARYIITGTARYEGTNKLGKARKSRWLPTWNVSGAWNAHEEPFWEALMPTFSHATLKGSYSLTADSGPDYVSNATAIFNPYTPGARSAPSRNSVSSLSLSPTASLPTRRSTSSTSVSTSDSSTTAST